MARKTYANYGGPVAWQNSPSTATPQSAANLNVADNALAAGFPVWGQLDQDETVTGMWTKTVTTGGTDKQVWGWTDTSTKAWGLFISSTGSLYIKNITDNRVVKTFLPGFSEPTIVVAAADPGAANFATGSVWIKDS